jgi:L-lysine 2,3-aminomutase
MQFTVTLKDTLNLIQQLRGWISGPAMPTFIVDGVGAGQVEPEFQWGDGCLEHGVQPAERMFSHARHACEARKKPV